MRDFPSCFGENAVQISDSSSSSSSAAASNRAAQNMVTSVYKSKFRGNCCFITITWTKSLMGQGLSVAIDDVLKRCSLCKVDIKPWLFSKRKGCKNLVAESDQIDIYWDLSSAKFGSGPEPLEGFYVIVVSNQELVLLLGDMEKVAFKKISPCPVPSHAVLIAKREHIFGKKVYCAKAQFGNKGQSHGIEIECDTISLIESYLEIRIDGKSVLKVKQLQWKFRGNQTVLVDSLPVEICWDVHNWLFGNATGSAVFMFETSFFAEKLSDCKSISDTSTTFSWSSSPHRLTDEKSSQRLAGFSLILSAWKND